MGYIWAVSIASVVKIIPTLFSTTACIKLSVIKQLEAILRYAVPFVLILLSWKFIDFNTGYYVFNIVLKGGLFFIIYILVNLLLKNDGLHICWSLIRKFWNSYFAQ